MYTFEKESRPLISIKDHVLSYSKVVTFNVTKKEVTEVIKIF